MCLAFFYILHSIHIVMVKGMTTIGIDLTVKIEYSKQKAIYASVLGHQISDDRFMLYLLDQRKEKK